MNEKKQTDKCGDQGELRQFDLWFLLQVMALISFVSCGSMYLGLGGGVFSATAGCCLWNGVVTIRRLRQNRSREVVYDAVQAFICLVVGLAALLGIVYWLVKFNSAFGFGWWRWMQW